MQHVGRQELQVLEEGIRAMESITAAALGSQSPLSKLAKDNAKRRRQRMAGERPGKADSVCGQSASEVQGSMPASQSSRTRKQQLRAGLPLSPHRPLQVQANHNGRSLGPTKRREQTPRQSPSKLDSKRAAARSQQEAPRCLGSAKMRDQVSQQSPSKPTGQEAAAALQRAPFGPRDCIANTPEALKSTAKGPLRANASSTDSSMRQRHQPIIAGIPPAGKAGRSTEDQSLLLLRLDTQGGETSQLPAGGVDYPTQDPSARGNESQAGETLFSQGALAPQQGEHQWHRVTTWVREDSFLAAALEDVSNAAPGTSLRDESLHAASPLDGEEGGRARGGGCGQAPIGLLRDPYSVAPVAAVDLERGAAAQARQAGRLRETYPAAIPGSADHGDGSEWLRVPFPVDTLRSEAAHRPRSQQSSEDTDWGVNWHRSKADDAQVQEGSAGWASSSESGSHSPGGRHRVSEDKRGPGPQGERASEEVSGGIKSRPDVAEADAAGNWQGAATLEERAVESQSRPGSAEAEILGSWQGDIPSEEHDCDDADSLVMRLELKVATRKLALYMRELDSAHAENSHLQDALQFAQDQQRRDAEVIKAECEERLHMQKQQHNAERDRLRTAMADQVALFRTEVEAKFQGNKVQLQERIRQAQDALLAKQATTASLEKQAREAKAATESERGQKLALERRLEELSQKSEEQALALCDVRQQKERLSQQCQEQAAMLTNVQNQSAELRRRIDDLSGSLESEQGVRLTTEAQVQDLAAELETARAAKSSLEKELEETKSGLEVARSEMANFAKRLDTQRECSKAEASARRRQLEERDAEICRCSKALNAQQTSLREAGQQRQALDAMLQDSRSYAEELKCAADTKLADVITAHEAQLAAMRAEADGKLRELAGRMERVLAEKSAAAEGEYAEQRDALLAEVAAAKREFEGTLAAERARCEQARAEAGTHKRRSSSLQDALDVLQGDLKHEKGDAFKKLQDAKRMGANEAHRLRQQVNDARVALETARRDAQETEKRAQALEDANTASQQQIHQAKLAVETARRDAKAAEERSQAMEASELATQKQLQHTGNVVQQLRGELEALRKRLGEREQDLLHQLEESAEAFSRAASELAHQHECNNSLRSELAHARDAAAAAQAQADRAACEEARAAAAMTAMRVEVDELRRQQAISQQEAVAERAHEETANSVRHRQRDAYLAFADGLDGSSRGHAASKLQAAAEDQVLRGRVQRLEREAALLAAERDLAVEDLNRAASLQACVRSELATAAASLQETKTALASALADAAQAHCKTEEISATLAEESVRRISAENRAQSADGVERARDEALQALAVTSGRLEEAESRTAEAVMRANVAEGRARDAERAARGKAEAVRALAEAARKLAEAAGCAPDAQKAEQGKKDALKALGQATQWLAESERRVREADEQRREVQEQCSAAEHSALVAEAERDAARHRLRSLELGGEGRAALAERAAEELQAQVATLQEREAQLQAAVTNLRLEKEEMCRRDNDAEAAAETAQVMRLDNGIKQLEQDLRQAEARATKTANRASVLEQRLVQLKTLLRAAHARGNRAETSAQALQAELGSVRETAARSQSVLRDTIAELEGELGRVREELREMEHFWQEADAAGRKQLTEATAAKDKAEQAVRSLQEALGAAIQEVEATRINFAAMRSKAASVPQSPVLLPKDENTWPDTPSARGKDERIKQLRRSLVRANDESAALQATADAFSHQLAANEQEKIKLVQQAVTLEQKLAVASQELVDTRLAASATQDGLQRQVKEAKASEARLQAEHDSLVVELEEASKQLQAARAEAAKQDLQAEQSTAERMSNLEAQQLLQSRLEGASQELLTSKAAIAENETEIARLSGALQAASQELLASHAAVADKEGESARLAGALQAASESHAAVLKELEGHKDALKQTVRDLEQAQTKAAADRVVLEGQTRGLKQTVRDLEEAHAQALADRDALEASLRSVAAQAETAAAASELRAARLEDEVQAQNVRVIERDAKVQQLDAELEAQRVSMEQLGAELSAQQTAMVQQNAQLEAQRKAVIQQDEELAARRKAQEELAATTEAQQRHSAALQRALESAQEQLGERAAAAAVVEAELIQLRTEKRLAEARAAELTEQLVHALGQTPSHDLGVSTVHRNQERAQPLEDRLEEHGEAAAAKQAGKSWEGCGNSGGKADASAVRRVPRAFQTSTPNLEQLAGEEDPWAELLSDDGSFADSVAPNSHQAGHPESRARSSSQGLLQDSSDDKGAGNSTLLEEVSYMQQCLVAAEAAVEKLDGEGQAKDRQIIELKTQTERLGTECTALKHTLEQDFMQQPVSASNAQCGRCSHLIAQLAAAERRAGRLSDEMHARSHLCSCNQ